MSQNPPTTPPTETRPLPRPRRSAPKPAARPRIVPMDILWMVVLAVILLITAAVLHGASALSGGAIWAAAGTVAALYLLGAQTRDRITGVVAGLLLATSAPFLISALGAVWFSWFTFTTIASLASYSAGSRTLALIFAAIATAINPMALLLGLVLLALISRREPAKALPFAGLYGVVGLGAFALLMALGHSPSSQLAFTGLSVFTWLAAPAMLLVLWFLVPFSVELSETPRRNRWLPALCWTILLGIGESLFHFRDGVSALPFMPLILLFIGAGVARLLPTMLGDIPNPVTRYVLASIAILSLPLLRAAVDTQMPHVAQPMVTRTAPLPTVSPHTTPAPIAAKPTPPPPPSPPKVVPAAPKPTPAVAVKPTPPPVKPKPIPVAAKPSVAKPKPAPVTSQPQIITVPHHIVEVNQLPKTKGVPLYTWKNGRMIKRSKWAIQWDLNHPKH